MSRIEHREGMGQVSFPRVSGDEPTELFNLSMISPFSPRERG